MLSIATRAITRAASSTPKAVISAILLILLSTTGSVVSLTYLIGGDSVVALRVLGATIVSLFGLLLLLSATI
jgi:hypothetical protein